MSDCEHTSIVTYQNKTFCHSCGLFMHSSNIYKNIINPTHYDPIKILQFALQPTQFQRPNFIDSRQGILLFMKQLGQTLKLSMNSLFLAIQYLDLTQPSKKLTLLSGTALMLAGKLQKNQNKIAKTCEIDQFIPFISRLRMSSMNLTHYNVKQFKQAEGWIIKKLDWKLAQVTLLDRVEILLSFGIINDEDSLINRNKKMKDLGNECIYQLVCQIEKDYKQVCFNILESEVYFEYDQAILAFSVIGYLRKKAGILNIWSQHLEELTNIKANEISQSVSSIITLEEDLKSGRKPLQNANVVKKLRRAATSYIKTSGIYDCQIDNNDQISNLQVSVCHK